MCCFLLITRLISESLRLCNQFCSLWQGGSWQQSVLPKVSLATQQTYEELFISLGQWEPSKVSTEAFYSYTFALYQVRDVILFIVHMLKYPTICPSPVGLHRTKDSGWLFPSLFCPSSRDIFKQSSMVCYFCIFTKIANH